MTTTATTKQISDAMISWLGPAADTMTDEQMERFEQAWDHVESEWPDPDDQDARTEYLTATAEYLLGDTTPARAAARLRAANAEVEAAKIAARAVARLAVDDGQPETRLAADLGVTRRTLRLWLGKDH